MRDSSVQNVCTHVNRIIQWIGLFYSVHPEYNWMNGLKPCFLVIVVYLYQSEELNSTWNWDKNVDLSYHNGNSLRISNSMDTWAASMALSCTNWWYSDLLALRYDITLSFAHYEYQQMIRNDTSNRRMLSAQHTREGWHLQHCEC